MQGDAHFGDWGFQMGLLIVAVGDARGLWSEVSEETGAFTGSPETVAARLDDLSLDDLEAAYPAAAAKAKEDAAFRDRARRATARLQAGGEAFRAVWERFVLVSAAPPWCASSRPLDVAVRPVEGRKRHARIP